MNSSGTLGHGGEGLSMFARVPSKSSRPVVGELNANPL